jgi:hypothetical protein
LRLWTRLGFTDLHMAELIGCDRKTVHRRRARLDIRKQDWMGLDPVELQPVRISLLSSPLCISLAASADSSGCQCSAGWGVERRERKLLKQA